MNIFSLALAVALAILVDTAWVALFRARPVGRFKVLRDAGGVFTFTSNAGTFSADQASQTLSYVNRRQRGSVTFSEIKGLEYRVNEKHAVLAELFFGFDLTDLLPRYQDTVEWFSIAVVTSEGKRIPLYLSGRYEPREFLLGWYIELQANFLARAGLLKNVEEHSRSVLSLIQSHLGNPKLL